MTSRIRVKLSDHHGQALDKLAAHYDVPESTLARLWLAKAIDAEMKMRASAGQFLTIEAAKGPELGKESPDFAQAGGPGAANREKTGPILPNLGKKGPAEAHPSPGTEPAILGSERERERDPNPLDPPSVAELTAELVELLNSEGGTTHSPHDQASQRAVWARLRGEGCEPASADDMRRVVMAKARAWRNTKYAAGLNLLTLLGDKFGQYLGTADVDTGESDNLQGGGAFGYLGKE